MPKRIELVNGSVFGRLTFLHEVETYKRNRYGLFRCTCGNEKIMAIHPVRAGKYKSCGCEWRTGKHGQCTKQNRNSTSLYKRWGAMKYRCDNPNSVDYPRYGGRGIKICSEWYDFKVFLQWAIDSGYVEHLTLDRRNNNKGYNPKNCRWVTGGIQAANKNKEKGTKFAYRGIQQLPSGNWHARLVYENKHITIGTFPTEHEALMARNQYIIDHNLPHTLG